MTTKITSVCDGVHLFAISATCPDAVRDVWDCQSSFSCNKREPLLRTPLYPFYDRLAQGQVVSAHCVISFMCVVTKKEVR